MSLKEAVEDVASRMEQRSSELYKAEIDGASLFSILIEGFVAQLRTAVKAAGDDRSRPSPLFVDPEAHHRDAIERARVEFRKGPKGLDAAVLAEEQEPTTFPCKGGSFDGDLIAVQGDVPELAFTRVGDEAYQLMGGALRYSPEETAKLRERTKR